MKSQTAGFSTARGLDAVSSTRLLMEQTASAIERSEIMIRRTDILIEQIYDLLISSARIHYGSRVYRSGNRGLTSVDKVLGGSQPK